MKQARYLLLILILSIVTLLIMSGRVNATPYSYSVDRFEVIGNIPVGAVDEFDDGSFESLWEIVEPGGSTAVVEADGMVTFGNPGCVQIEDGYLLREFSRIYAQPSSILQVEYGAGDFQGTSSWLPAVPGTNQFFGMSLIRRSHFDAIGISVANFASDITDTVGIAGLPEGLSILLSHDSYLQSVPIMAGTITDDILLQLSYDNVTNQVTGGFSLDGGATFQSPFSPITPTSGGPALVDWRIGAESWELRPVPEPSTLLLLVAGLIGLAGKRFSKKAEQ